MTHVEDLAFFMTLADRTGLHYGHIDQVVYKCRTNPGSAMSDLAGLERGYLQLLRLSRSLRHATAAERIELRVRIAKILLLSWRARGELNSGFKAAAKALTV